MNNETYKHESFPLTFSSWDDIGDFCVQLYDVNFTEQFGPFSGNHECITIDHVKGEIKSYNQGGEIILSCKYKHVPVGIS